MGGLDLSSDLQGRRRLVTWFLLVVTALNMSVFYYIGRCFVFLPPEERPRLFWDIRAQVAAIAGPPLIALSVVVAGFVFTEGGWWILALTIFLWIQISYLARKHAAISDRRYAEYAERE